MKAIIPVAGIGSRLRPHTHTQPKALVPVAGKPILGHIIDSITEVGITEFVFVIGYLGDKIQSYVTETYPQLNKSFVVQAQKEGIGHAIWTAKELINEQDEVIIVLGDTIFDVNLKEVISLPYSAVGLKKVEDPRNFGVVEMDEEGYITKLVEKPNIPKSNMAMVGIYKIKEAKALMNALNHLIENDARTHNEFQLTDALMHMVNEGIKIKSFKVDEWYDCGKKEILLATNAMLLSRMKNIDTPQFQNTIIIQPVSIPASCRIQNSIIGPNVSIGENTYVDHSILKNSIIGSYSQLEDVVLRDSLVGSDASLKGLTQSLNLGDSTEINFSAGH
jgi:glucose-1-phosphate thymidylyltransferase